MARLIVEEGGQRRAFKVGDGVLSLGSGGEARLRLASTDVAEVHAEISIEGGVATLRPRPGVVPPTLGGVPVSEPARLDPGVEVRVGSARLWLEADDGSAPPPAPAAAAAPAAPAAPAAQGGARAQQASARDHAIRRQAAMAEARGRGARSVVQRTKPRVKRGVPGYLIAILIVAGVGVGGLLFWRAFQSSAGAGPSGNATLAAARRYIEEGNWEIAKQQLEAMAVETPEERAERDQLLKEVAGKFSQAELDSHNQVGTRYKDTKLAKYANLYLAGTPEKPKVRVYLQRIRYFKERWPDHPDMDWVERQEDRYRGLVKLSDPTTLEDVQWEVECLTRTSPRDYKESFALVDEFLERASGSDAEAARELREQMEADRREYHTDRMLQAQYEFDRDAPGAAVSWLVHAITKIGDREMENEAATYLLKMPNVEEHLEGYRSRLPEEWDRLIEHPMIRSFAKENGLL